MRVILTLALVAAAAAAPATVVFMVDGAPDWSRLASALPPPTSSCASTTPGSSDALAVVSDTCATSASTARMFVEVDSPRDTAATAFALRAINMSVILGGFSRLLSCADGTACCPLTRADLARRCTGSLNGGFGDMHSALAFDCAPLAPADRRPRTQPFLSDMLVAALAHTRATSSGVGAFVVVGANLLVSRPRIGAEGPVHGAAVHPLFPFP